MGNEQRVASVLPLPSFQVCSCKISCYVDGASQAARRPSGAEVVLYRHVCDDDDATVALSGDWWLGGPVPCPLARAAAPLAQYQVLSWNSISTERCATRGTTRRRWRGIERDTALLGASATSSVTALSIASRTS